MPKAIDLTGHKFGRLTALKLTRSTSGQKTAWLCECDCGKKVIINTDNLRSNHTRSCGCLKTPRDLTGQKFGRWTVLRRNGENAFGAIMWLCRCDCGKESSIHGYQLTMGRSLSCGCLRDEVAFRMKLKHGRYKTPEYNSWDAMIQRCYNPNARYYYCYGGRGITVCDRWRESFENFCEDMGPKPTSEHSIDRINNNGNYEPGNCRWATPSQQNSNKRRRAKVS